MHNQLRQLRRVVLGLPRVDYGWSHARVAAGKYLWCVVAVGDAGASSYLW
jgi:hypothetical protein